MALRTWIAGTIGKWFDVDNWQTAPPDPNDFPQPGDTAVITSGKAIITAADQPLGPIVGETIVLGSGPDSVNVALDVTSATFMPSGTAPLEIHVRSGQLDEPLTARFVGRGTTSFEGQIYVETFGGRLILSSRSGDGSDGEFVFEQGDTFVFVNQDSHLDLTGETFRNEGLIEVEGFGKLAASASLIGDGTVQLDESGTFVAAGAVGANVRFALGSGRETLVIGDLDTFDAEIGLPSVGTTGDRIVLRGVSAQSASYADGVLTLHAGPNETGAVVGELDIRLINFADLDPLPPDEQTLTAADFTLRTTATGTLVTYAPVGPVMLEASMPVPVVAEPGTTVPLATVFELSFGTATPDFYGITLVPPDIIDSEKAYWGQPPRGERSDPAWIVNGEAITERTTVGPDDEVLLRVGNNIGFPPQIEVQVTPGATGPEAEYVTYDVWTVDPAVAQLVGNAGVVPGAPDPADIVVAATSLGAVFPGVFNSDLCNWIADDVAAAAGAAMPLPNFELDPRLNVEGGFWRIVYRGSDTPDPVQDWSNLVQPGDVVRMEHLSGGGHTTTVLGVNPDGTITVYDNIDIVDGTNTIGIHDASYWEHTDPASITIYRLDPNHQYLIEGTDLGEYMQGSVFDDLIYARGGDDIVKGSVGADEIRAGGGDDVVRGEDGDDAIYGGPGNDTATGGVGDDVLAGNGGNDTIGGNAGDDTLAGGPGDDVLAGNTGNDRLQGGTGNDTVYGGGDDDLLAGNDGADRLIGGPGNDTAFGGSGDDLLAGNAGEDVLHGGTGNDIVYGGPGDDVIAGDAGFDQLAGGTGRDAFRFRAGDDVDVIAGFVIGEDVIVLAASLGAKSFAGIGFSQVGDSAVLDFGGAGAVLPGIDMSQLSPSDFQFL